MIIREDHFICSGGIGFKALLKMRIQTDLATISALTFETINTSMSGTALRGCCTDGVHVFLLTNLPAIHRYLCLDLSFVDQVEIFNGSDVFHNPIGITVYVNWLYVSDRISNGVNRIIRFLKTDLSYIDEIPLDSTPAYGLDNNGLHLYVAQNENLV